MKLPFSNLVDLIAGHKVESALLTSFSLDEAVLLTLAHEGRLPTDRTRVLYDATRFRHFETPRVWRRWLRPMSLIGGTRADSLPPVWHPKLAAFRLKGRAPLLVLSSANLSPGDQRTGNHLIALDLRPAEFARLERWGSSATPARTVLVRVGRGQRKLVLDSKSTWHHFQAAQSRDRADEENWIIASPFLSPGGLRLLGDRAVRRTLQLFATTESAARALAKASPPFASANGWLPAARSGFHQKVIAVRARHGRTISVVLYAGSANFTFRGFLGRNGRAGNAEAGALFVGGAELWPVAQALARAGVATWRRVPLRCKGDGELDGEEELGADDREASTAFLEASLASRLSIRGRNVTLRAAGARGVVRLLRASLLVDDKAHRVLKPGVATGVPSSAKAAVVQGDFLITGALPPWWDNKRHQSVQLDIPSALAEVMPERFAPGVGELRRLLNRHVVAGSKSERGDEMEFPEAEADGKTLDDVRFPWADWTRFAGTASPQSVARWLELVGKSPAAPAFWTHIARALEDA